MQTLYFDCFAGASGNMILGALLDAGVDPKELRRRISTLNIPAIDLEIDRVDRSGLAATHVNVKVPHEHIHRNLNDIIEIIEQSNLKPLVQERATAIFRRLAEAEAKVHGINVEAVHFHEVGALDAIVDVVGACIAFDMLEIDAFCCSRINVGWGFVDMAHGRFPVPPPAVSGMLGNFPIYSNEIEGELTTPTGAAIISTLCDTYGQMPDMILEVVGYGAGSRTYSGFPNALRIMIGQTSELRQRTNLSEGNCSVEKLLVLETNLDDSSPQVLGYVMERLFAAKVLDCWFTAIQMKKNRPATMLSVLCRPEDFSSITEIIYKETTTLGIRIREAGRHCLEREIVRVNTEFGEIDIKIGRTNGSVANLMPEFDQARSLAKKNGVSLREVQSAAIKGLDRALTAKGSK